MLRMFAHLLARDISSNCHHLITRNHVASLYNHLMMLCFINRALSLSLPRISPLFYSDPICVLIYVFHSLIRTRFWWFPRYMPYIIDFKSHPGSTQVNFFYSSGCYWMKVYFHKAKADWSGKYHTLLHFYCHA